MYAHTSLWLSYSFILRINATDFYRFPEEEFFDALQTAPKEKARVLILKLLGSATKYGAKFDKTGRKHTKTIISDIQEYLATVDEDTAQAILKDVLIEDWTQDMYGEVLGTELATTVLEMAGAQQELEARDAAVLDNTTADPHDTTEPVTHDITQNRSQEQDPARTRDSATATATTEAVGEGNNAMPPPPARNGRDFQDDSTEYQEFMQLRGEEQQQQGPPLNAEQAFLAALHEAQAQGVDIDASLMSFADQYMAQNTPRMPAAAQVPVQQDPMTLPIPKRPRQDTVPIWDARRSNQSTTRVPSENRAFVNSLFPPTLTVGGVPIPSPHLAQGGFQPCDMIGASDNAQAMGYYHQGKTVSVTTE